MSDLMNYLFPGVMDVLPVELVAVFYLCYGLVIVKAIADIFLLFVRSVCRVR